MNNTKKMSELGSVPVALPPAARQNSTGNVHRQHYLVILAGPTLMSARETRKELSFSDQSIKCKHSDLESTRKLD